MVERRYQYRPAWMADETRALVVVANRLAVAWDQEAERWRAGPGGLVAALSPVLRERRGAWVGWTGVSGSHRSPFEYQGVRQHPVPLTKALVRHYYQGFCNRTVWPLYHDAIRSPEIHRHWWRAYVEANARFAREATAAAEPEGVVWVHDYQLQLVPVMLRRLLPPGTSIGFFLHIPFPPVELFERLPWRSDLVEGMLGADVIGFQTHRGVINFGRAARRFVGAQGSSGSLRYEGRTIRVEAAPISVDFRALDSEAHSVAVEERSAQLRADLGEPELVVLGVDRLDYTKGIDRRLRALESLLQRRADLRGKIVFVQVAVPSRETLPYYQSMRDEVERIVGRLNGRFGRPSWTPVHYLYRSIPRRDLLALYRLADVMVVTPLRDGMNLVAKEYVATHRGRSGVLVLSEFAGAALQLTEALIVNPYDVDGLAAALERAVELPLEEQRRRMSRLRRSVQQSDVHAWAAKALASIAG